MYNFAHSIVSISLKATLVSPNQPISYLSLRILKTPPPLIESAHHLHSAMLMETGQHPKRVLLVEDDPLDVNLIRRALSRTGAEFELRILEDGEQAISFVKMYSVESWTPELILLDLNLPRRLGGEVLSAIKAHPKLKVVPVVVLTSSEAQSDVVNAYKGGASSYVRKPFSLESIDDLVRTLQHYWFDLVILPSRATSA